MSLDIDRTIDFSYKILAVLWVVGALCLAYSVLSDDDSHACSIAELHLDTCCC